MRRRAFLLFSAAGALLSQVMRPLLPQPALGTTWAPLAKANSGRAVDVAAVAELNRAGQLLVRSSTLGPVLLLRDPGTKQLGALDPTCPHRGCLVVWQPGSGSLLCPCHQARFDATGRWLEGQPVRRPLQAYRVTVRNGRVLVSQA